MLPALQVVLRQFLSTAFQFRHLQNATLQCTVGPAPYNPGDAPLQPLLQVDNGNLLVLKPKTETLKKVPHADNTVKHCLKAASNLTKVMNPSSGKKRFL